MKKISILLIGIFASISSFAKDYSQAEIETILQENEALKAENAEYSKLAEDAIKSLKDGIKVKNMLKKAGLVVDKNSGELKLVDNEAFMMSCNVVVFADEEIDALGANNPLPAQNLNQGETQGENKIHMREEDAAAEKDFRKAAKGDFSDKSKDFWNNVIY